MANYELVSKVAHLRNISRQFVDFNGNQAEVANENIEMIIRAMGYDLDDESKFSHDAWQLDTQQWKKLLEPVTVLSPLREYWGVNLYATTHDLMSVCAWSIELEQGEQVAGRFNLDMLEQTGDYWMADVQHIRRVLPLPLDLPIGYHQITVLVGNVEQKSPLVVTPKTSYQPEAMANGKKIWGSAVQLYTLRSERNWGIGDFTDLTCLVQDMANQGADFIGLNPMHALYPINPNHNSPYSPSNRSFLNILYTDITAVPEFEHSRVLKEKVNSQPFKLVIDHLRASPNVEYAGVSDLKHECFIDLYDTFKTLHLGNGTMRESEYLRFIEQQGEALQQHAAFEALLSHFKSLDVNAWSWPVWPDAYRDHDSSEVQQFILENQDAVRYWTYLQFIADEQLQRVDRLATSLGMTIGLYRDLAVGADIGGAEVWSNKASYCVEASIGAPPDALGPNGQNWGLPPLDPAKLKEQGYNTFITLLRNNMRSCGALRLDHAMALARLWWCPQGKFAAEGAYVHYDLFDMLGILNLESQRNQCLVIAEDLGTVPDNVREYFPQAELYSNKVFCFEMNFNSCTEPKDYAQKALAVVCNHDMPTLKAFWSKSDLNLRWDLGMFDSEAEYHQERVTRERAKQLIIDLLLKHNNLPSGMSDDASQVEQMTQELCFAIHIQLAVCNSQLVAIQLEDLMLMSKPINIPGTSSEYPNWRRKLDISSSALFAKPEIIEFCSKFNHHRHS